jgi:hypothetical protein
MSVGAQASKAVLDQNLTQLALQLRSAMQQIQNEWTFVNNGAAGSPVEVLTALGYDNANSDAPGGQSDASYASYLLNNLNTMAGLYFGTATQASPFDFANALAPLSAAQP